MTGTKNRPRGMSRAETAAWVVMGDRSARDDQGCLIWLGGRRNGYGQIYVDGQTMSVHRLVYEQLIHRAPLPAGLSVHHECGRGTEGCVEPTHLALATTLQNVGEMHARKGYQATIHYLESRINDLNETLDHVYDLVVAGRDDDDFSQDVA